MIVEIAFFLIILTIWVAYLYGALDAEDKTKEKRDAPLLFVRVGKTAVRAELATTPWQLTKGLMFRKKQSMLLQFPYAGRHSIWTLFMQFPLDLIYLDEEKRVVSVIPNTRPLTLNPATWRFYRPKRKARYVLETPAGLAEEYSIREGTKASW